MFVIVTGPDRAGKTTLVSKLQEQIYFNIIHKGVAPKTDTEANEVLWDILVFRLKNMDKSFLCDRLNYPDDLIYSPIVTGTNNSLMERDQAAIERVLKQIDPFFVYVTCDIDTLSQRWLELGEDPYVSWEQTVAIHALYEHFFANTEYPYIRIDTSIHDSYDTSDITRVAIENHYTKGV